MSYHHHLHHHYRHRARHPDLEFDRFFSVDPSMPFSVSRYRTHDYDDMDFSSPHMVEDRMESLVDLSSGANTLTNATITTNATNNKTPTTKQLSETFPPTTSSSNLNASGAAGTGGDDYKKPCSSINTKQVSSPRASPLLLDLNVDIIDDDGPFSLKSQQQLSPFRPGSGTNKPNKRTPQPHSMVASEISELYGFVQSSSVQPAVQPQQENVQINDDDNNNEDDREVERMLQTDSPTHSIKNGDILQQQENSWLPIDLYQHDNLGLKVTSGSITITKDGNTNMIGISIGGGAPNCPCLYIVQVFDNTPAAKDGTLQSGDEITGVNNVSVKGKTKVEVAKMIQSIKNEVTISYNKLHADAAQGKSLDIILKKVKHRLVENMSSATADALGLSRAILCNDNLVKKLTDLQRTEVMYRGLVEHTQRLLRAYLELLRVIKLFGETFAVIGVREPQPRASLAFTQFADYHRNMEKKGVEMVKKLKPILSDLGTYLHKAIPDTKLTIGKYADAKFEYLSFCLKVKEMDDEEFNYASVQEPLYRVETGNYEYRLVLRCRQEARARFAQLRSDVQVKLELLDNKHVQDVATQLQKLSKGLAEFYEDMHDLSKENANLFPVEVDLTDNAFIYEKSFEIFPPDETSADEQ